MSNGTLSEVKDYYILVLLFSNGILILSFTMTSAYKLYGVLFQRCSSTAMLTVPACLFLMFHISVEGASTTREYAWGKQLLIYEYAWGKQLLICIICIV